jgi:hypothetical protein
MEQFRILVLISLTGCGLLGCAGTARTSISEESYLLSQSTGSAFDSFADAIQLLKKLLIDEGYNEFDGDHGIGTAESFHATSPVDSVPDLRVNTSWLQNKPLGSYTRIDETGVDGEAVVGLSRLDAKGAWINCGSFQFEILSTRQFEQAATVRKRVAQRLGC